MDRFESDLRDALHRPPRDHDADDLLRAVHAGARRRRQHRLAAAALGVAAVVAVGALAVGATTGRDRAGDVAGSPGPSAPGTPSAPSTPSAPATPTQGRTPLMAVLRHALWVAPLTAQRWWVLSAGACADGSAGSCAVLTDVGSGTALPLPSIPLPAEPSTPLPDTVDQVVLDAGGTDGWLFGGALWTTHDAGRTWQRASLPDGAQVTSLATYDGQAYALTDGPAGPQVLSTPVSADDWRALATPAGLEAAGTPIVATKGAVAFVAHDLTARGSVVVSSPDGGRTWSTAPSPCGAVDSTASSASSLWLTCQAESGGAVMTSSDGAAWSRKGTAALGEGARLAPVDDTATLVYLGERAVLLDGGGASPVDLPLRRGEVIWSAAFAPDGTGFLVTSRGAVLRSTDAGASWQRLR